MNSHRTPGSGIHICKLCGRDSFNTAGINTSNQRLELEDGDFLDLAWTHTPDTDQPIIVIFHGLEGCVQSPYIQNLLQAVLKSGWCGVLMHFRSCSGELNRLARSYHSGETGDIGLVIDLLREHYPTHPLFAVGYSLGGNALLKYLGERTVPGIRGAIAVSVPFQLNRGADRLQQGFSRFYQWYLLSKLKKKTQEKFGTIESPIDINALKHYNDFWQFDHHITAPVHGFASAKDYYQRCSSRQYLKNITIPTHILHAKDDPFLPADAIPCEDDLSQQVTLELSDRGGHVGFISGKNPFKPTFWLEQRIPAVIDNMLNARS